MSRVHGRSATAMRRAGGVIAVCCALGAGALTSAPGASAAAPPGAGEAAVATASPGAPSSAPSAGGFPSGQASGPPNVGAGAPAAVPDGKAASAARADLALHTEFGPTAVPAPQAAPEAVPEAAPEAGAGQSAAGVPATRPVPPPRSAPTAPAADTTTPTAAPTAEAPGAARAERLAPDADGVFDYRVTALNHGPSQAVDVVITDQLPRQLVFVSSPDGCTAQGRTITCGPLPALAVGASHTWLITVALADDYSGDGSDITNVVAVSSQTADPDPANNTASLTGVHVPPGTGKADLSLRKTALLPDGRRWVRPGETFSYRVTVHNDGPSTARNVQVTDPLPEVLRFVSSPDGCTAAGTAPQTVRCPLLDRLPAGESVAYEIVVRVRESEPRAGGGDGHGDGHGGHGGGHGGDGSHGGRLSEIDNIASVTSTTRDPVPGNNRNPSGTTGPGGGPLYLKHPSGPTRPPHPTDPGRPHPGDPHPGRPQLPNTGRELPGWLPWSAGTTLAAGGALVVLARRTRR
ncbi:DUF11 domain-containing protein [Streptomyces sp. NPDC020141]|uniref:DUF11 domain-containing protein n=1 Tax=Streptomyces sp. NPDC020141 TaxID=3365065 RepID=UPI00379BAFE0